MTGTPPIRPVGQQNKGINLLVYGANGVGKTPFLATSPNCLILSADPNGTASAIGSGADEWEVKEWEDLENAHEYLRNEKHKYKWVWLDSISGFQDIGLEDIMLEVVAKPGKSYRKVWHPDKGEYGENMNRLKLWTRHMASLPINFGLTAYPFQTETDEGEIEYMPYVQGKGMTQTICGYMSVIGYMEVVEKDGESKQVLNFRKRELYYARDRFGALPARMVNPSVPKIEQLISNSAAKPKAAATTKKSAASRTVAKRAAVRPNR